MPVGSNLPDMTGRGMTSAADWVWATTRSSSRHSGRSTPPGWSATSSRGPTRWRDWSRECCSSTWETGHRRSPGLDPRIEVHRPGALPAERVARHLACADIFLAPFSDGVSTRRTTLMAALQHGLPVVGTSGESTDSMLTGSTSAIRLLPVGDVTGFGAAVRLISEDADLRLSMAEAARVLYTSRVRLAGRRRAAAESSQRPGANRRELRLSVTRRPTMPPRARAALVAVRAVTRGPQ